jgi:hypothetical protein
MALRMYRLCVGAICSPTLWLAFSGLPGQCNGFEILIDVAPRS